MRKLNNGYALVLILAAGLTPAQGCSSDSEDRDAGITTEDTRTPEDLEPMDLAVETDLDAVGDRMEEADASWMELPWETSGSDLVPEDSAASDLEAELPLDTSQPGQCIPTLPDAQGPYYLEGAPFKTSIAGPEEPGERIIIKGMIRAEDCLPLDKAVVDVWQTDADGNYPGAEDGYKLRGKVQAAADGTYSFETVLPGFYELRPRHIHVKVSAPGAGLLTTQLYFQGDPYLWPEDSCRPPTCHSDDPLRILELVPEEGTDRLVAVMDFTLETEPGR